MNTRAFIPALGALALACLSGCSVFRHAPAAPHVMLVNNSDARITVRHWTGKLDYREPTGVGDWRMAEEETLEAGACAYCSVGRFEVVAGNTDLVVRMEIEYLDPVTLDPHHHWVELTKPAPYKVVFDQSDEGIAFRSGTRGPLVSVPEEEQIPGRLDDLPIWDAQGRQLPVAAR